jgi:hypothetical protein
MRALSERHNIDSRICEIDLISARPADPPSATNPLGRVDAHV